MSEVYNGEVIWFHVGRNYGFIRWEKDNVKQKDLFVHYSDISMDGFKLLKADQKVSFSLGKNHEGRLKAIDVKIIQ